MLLEGKSAIVTGAASGVGRASSIRFAEEGAKVVAADVNIDGAKETVQQIEAAGGTAVAVNCDVSQEPDVAALVAAAVDQYGRLDIMFNNVGVPQNRARNRLEEHTVEDFERLNSVNVRGVFLGMKHSVLQFKKQGGGGVILSTGSVAGLVGWGGVIYGSTKGAVHQLTKAAAIELAGDRIRVNAICPAGMPFTGYIAAGFDHPLEESMLAAAAESVAKQHPLGRPILAEDCAEAAVFLCSDRAANITGVLMPVDGGYVAR